MDPIVARSTTRVPAPFSTICRYTLAHSFDAASQINDSKGNAIVGDKALLFQKCAIATELLDFVSSSDNAATELYFILSTSYVNQNF